MSERVGRDNSTSAHSSVVNKSCRYVVSDVDGRSCGYVVLHHNEYIVCGRGPACIACTTPPSTLL